MNSDGNNEECLVEQLRKELRDLTWEEEETKQMLKKQRYKNEEAKKERNEIKLILEKEEMEIAMKEEELKHFRARVQLRCEKVENMRQQIIVKQMRKAEAEEQIEELKKTLEEVKVKVKVDQQLLIDRLKAVQNKLLNASWVISRRKEEEELAGLHKQIEEARVKKERLLQSIQEKEAIFAESRELPFTNFCVAVAAIALKNHALLKKLAQEYVIIAQLTQELSDQGILDTSILSQYSQSQTSQIQPSEEKKTKESPLCINGIADGDVSEEAISFDCMREKNTGEAIGTNFQADNELHFDFQKEVDSTITMPDDGKLKEDIKIIVINEETEENLTNTAMEVDKHQEVLQMSDELNERVTEFEESIFDMNEKNVSVDEKTGLNLTSDKDSSTNFISNFTNNSEEVETAISGRSEGENIVDYNDDDCKAASINLQPVENAESDLDPTNFFETVNQSGPIAGANDYMALFGNTETNASSRDDDGFELDFGNSPGRNEVKDKINKDNNFFDF
uniref:Bm9757 n=1 Tax=Brugia malayi TaxID=6279 RepID=A0A0H5S6S9_BRUMA|nr:Bm9757 [Brugia malayi]